MMKTHIFFITFSILILLHGHDVVCPFVTFVPNILVAGDVVGVNYKQSDLNSKQYLMIIETNSEQDLIATRDYEMLLKGEIVEHLSIRNSDYLKKVKKLIEDKLLEESTLDYAKNRLLVLSDDDFHTKKASDNLDNVKQFVEAFAEGRHAAAKSPKETSVRTSKEWEIFE
ncbi:uncharacterized protein LOC126838850 isoform X2 [Adelges cooleyi]|uniref:uncharacterized protein LOC126838850 isoform X2 n=1 Tax=Adelges cooleyi TaxID=133065 RepID=UPI00217FC81E|nr:uncharacterized protein LOC126838850 isoform X2 [Adelges cooleyi]